MHGAAELHVGSLRWRLPARLYSVLCWVPHSPLSCLCRASASNSGWNGTYTPFQDSWPSPRNKYFVDLVSFGWAWEEVPGTQRVQYVPAQGQQANYTAADGTPVIRLPSDIVSWVPDPEQACGGWGWGRGRGTPSGQCCCPHADTRTMCSTLEELPCMCHSVGIPRRLRCKFDVTLLLHGAPARRPSASRGCCPFGP